MLRAWRRTFPVYIPKLENYHILYLELSYFEFAQMDKKFPKTFQVKLVILISFKLFLVMKLKCVLHIVQQSRNNQYLIILIIHNFYLLHLKVVNQV